jgi:hypothetical protein
LGLWILTPIVASFGTLALGNRLQRIVFFSAETGNIAGDGPWTLYAFLGKLLIVAWLLSIVVLQALPVSADGDGDTGGVIGGFAGFAGFCFQLYTGTVSAPSWILVPTGWLAGLIIGSLINRKRCDQSPLARGLALLLALGLCVTLGATIMGVPLPATLLSLGPP